MQQLNTNLLDPINQIQVRHLQIVRDLFTNDVIDLYTFQSVVRLISCRDYNNECINILRSKFPTVYMYLK